MASLPFPAVFFELVEIARFELMTAAMVEEEIPATPTWIRLFHQAMDDAAYQIKLAGGERKTPGPPWHPGLLEENS